MGAPKGLVDHAQSLAMLVQSVQNTCLSARSSIDCTNPEVFPPKFLPGNNRTDRTRRRCVNPRTGAAVAMGQPFSGVASRSIYPLALSLAGQAGTVLCDVGRFFESAPLGRLLKTCIFVKFPKFCYDCWYNL